MSQNSTSENGKTDNRTSALITDRKPGPLTIANWNLQVFGDTKSADADKMNRYAHVIGQYDAVFVQEIRDKDGSAFVNLCKLLPNYSCLVSSRAGRTSSKEQVGLIYRPWIEILNWTDFNPDPQNRWERPPFAVTLHYQNLTLTVYNLHAKPDDVSAELTALQDIVNVSGPTAVMGDLNADCGYFNPQPRTVFTAWNWVIPDNEDTTAHDTDCAYDRILLENTAFARYFAYGVQREGIDLNLSDHYLVWAAFSAS